MIELEMPELDANDLKVDVWRRNGCMGPTPRPPHAVRITHIPTGKQAIGYHDCVVRLAKEQAMQQLRFMLKDYYYALKERVAP